MKLEEGVIRPGMQMQVPAEAGKARKQIFHLNCQGLEFKLQVRAQSLLKKRKEVSLEPRLGVGENVKDKPRRINWTTWAGLRSSCVGDGV